ncbi:type IV pilus assembly protein PilM [Vibrio navarrensis]|uniref:Type IV pilus assembly protein PilM n=1 Tax=Vibrio navarrensis TaxID=29495 RepID=A0AAI9G9W0_9VIBR|nr:type IV pilus assembly protein PilM [Vibrio navarrensis]
MGKPLVTGIDIGHRSLKAVILKPAGNSYALLGYKEIVFERAIVAENHTLNHQEIVNTLKVLNKELPRFRRQVALAVPDSAVISKQLQIEPIEDEKECEIAILQAFSHQSPFPVDELNIDYVRLHEPAQSKSASQSVQIFATKKEVVESRVRAAQAVRLKPVLVDMHAHCLSNLRDLAAQRYPDKSAFCLLDVGAQTTSLIIHQREKTHFIKEFAYGVEHLNAAIGDEFSAHDAQEKTERFIVEMVDRVARQLQLFQSINSQDKPQGLWLCGEGAATPLLLEALSRRLSLECELLNPLGLFEMKVARKKRRSVDWHHFSVAAGLAIGGIQWLENKHEAHH